MTPEPDESVRAVIDRDGEAWIRDGDEWGRFGTYREWSEMRHPVQPLVLAADSAAVDERLQRLRAQVQRLIQAGEAWRQACLDFACGDGTSRRVGRAADEWVAAVAAVTQDGER